MNEDIIARLPMPQEQAWLNVVRTAPVLEITRTCYDHQEDVGQGESVLWLNRIVVVAALFVMHYEHRGEALWKE